MPQTVDHRGAHPVAAEPQRTSPEFSAPRPSRFASRHTSTSTLLSQHELDGTYGGCPRRQPHGDTRIHAPITLLLSLQRAISVHGHRRETHSGATVRVLYAQQLLYAAVLTEFKTCRNCKALGTEPAENSSRIVLEEDHDFVGINAFCMGCAKSLFPAEQHISKGNKEVRLPTCWQWLQFASK